MRLYQDYFSEMRLFQDYFFVDYCFLVLLSPFLLMACMICLMFEKNLHLFLTPTLILTHVGTTIEAAKTQVWTVNIWFSNTPAVRHLT